MITLSFIVLLCMALAIHIAVAIVIDKCMPTSDYCCFSIFATLVEILTNNTRKRVEEHAETKDLSIEAKENEESKLEYEFWFNLAKSKLKPESANLGKVEELKEKLRALRNLALLVLLLMNIMWIVFLYTLIFPQLTKYNLPDRAFSLFFLVIFSLIIFIQFIAMMFHRFITLVHFLARTKLKIRRLDASWLEVSRTYTKETIS